MIAALFVLLARALAQDEFVVVLPAADPLDDRRVHAALEAAGYAGYRLVSGAEFIDRIEVVNVTDRASDEDCGGSVALDAWRRRMEVARARLSERETDAALAELVTLDLELGCLDAPPSALDLLGFFLAAAEAHQDAARNDPDLGGQELHGEEARAAIARAAALGGALAIPPDVAPVTREALQRARQSAASQAAPSVVAAGPGAKAGARLNGRPLARGAMVAVAGPNLVQVASARGIEAAANISLTPGSRVILWLDPGGRPRGSGDLLQELGAVSHGQVTSAPMLAAAAFLDASEVLYVGRHGSDIALWRSTGPSLVRADGVDGSDGPAPATREPDAWSSALGAGVVGAWSSLSGGPLTGLGGVVAGVGIHGRVGFLPSWSAAFSLEATGNAEPASGGGTVVRVTFPVRAGVRWGPRGGGWCPEAGADLLAHALGRYDEEQRIGVGGVLSAGAARALGARGGVRVEAYGGVVAPSAPGESPHGIVGAAARFEARR